MEVKNEGYQQGFPKIYPNTIALIPCLVTLLFLHNPILFGSLKSSGHTLGVTCCLRSVIVGQVTSVEQVVVR